MARWWYHSRVDADQGPPAPSRQLVIGGAIGLALLYAFRFSTLQLLVDDAFISFRYAETLARHGELVFNLGERVEGYSNPLWTLTLALGAVLGMSPVVVAPALGFGLGLLTLALVVVATHRLLACRFEIALGAGAVVALQPAWCFWTGAGLETPLFALELVALWAASWVTVHWRAALLTGALGALLAVTRPEGAVAALLVAPILAWRGTPRPVIGLAAALALGLPLAHLGWRLGYYGSWIPNPVVAKAAFSWAGLQRGLEYVGSYLFREGVLCLLPLIAIAPRSRPLVALWALILGYVGFVIVAGGDGLYRHRLLAHVTPALALAAAPGAQWLLARGRPHRVALALAITLELVLPGLEVGFFRGHSLAEIRDWEARWTLVGQALEREIPTDAWVATNVAGRVPYYSRRPTLDLLGLTDPVVAATPSERRGTGYAGHERAAPGYVLDRAPDVIYLSVVDGMPFAAVQRLDVVRDVLRRGSLYRYAALVEDARFACDYAPARLPLADGHQASVFLRRGSSSHLLPADWAAAP